MMEESGAHCRRLWLSAFVVNETIDVVRPWSIVDYLFLR